MISCNLVPILMRRTIIILILIYLYPDGYSQVIKGKVMDSNTKAGIEFAAVYFSGTSVGTRTNADGYFELNISDYKSMPLTISTLGYYSAVLTDFSYNATYFVYLTPKEYELGEIVISAKNYARKRRINLNAFKREFLGTTSNAKSCLLENENDIKLTIIPESDTLKAYSVNPIIIHNKALGYTIIYYLDKFEYSMSKGYLSIIGNYIFLADTTSLIDRQAQFERKRKSAFLGSRMHFFRSLWENNLHQAGFIIKDSSNVRLTYDKFVAQTDSSSKHINYKGTMYVYYHSGLQQSEMRIVKDYVHFDENGFFDPLGIFWHGEMAKKRIGDLLPFEYRPK
jgi:hypothetical protein